MIAGILIIIILFYIYRRDQPIWGFQERREQVNSLLWAASEYEDQAAHLQQVHDLSLGQSTVQKYTHLYRAATNPRPDVPKRLRIPIPDTYDSVPIPYLQYYSPFAINLIYDCSICLQRASYTDLRPILMLVQRVAKDEYNAHSLPPPTTHEEKLAQYPLTLQYIKDTTAPQFDVKRVFLTLMISRQQNEDQWFATRIPREAAWTAADFLDKVVRPLLPTPAFEPLKSY